MTTDTVQPTEAAELADLRQQLVTAGHVELRLKFERDTAVRQLDDVRDQNAKLRALLADVQTWAPPDRAAVIANRLYEMDTVVGG